MNKFEIGNTYTTTRNSDHTMAVTLSVAHRTAKTIVTTEGKRLRINTREDGSEFVFPEGRFSLCPVIRA